MRPPKSKRPEGDPRRLALDLLARREHSAAELRRKLTRRGVAPGEAAELVGDLAGARLQSDERFAEQYAASRRERGYGPLRIAAELRERGVPDPLIGRFVDAHDPEWVERARAVRRKRFGAPGGPRDLRERARQARFLQYRGFSPAQVRAVLGDGDGDGD